MIRLRHSKHRSEDDKGDAMRASFICGAVILALVIGIGLLAGCAKETPPFVTVEHPVLPAECFTASPPEPKLPAEDISDLGAVRDREALKTALRTEKAYRRTCGERLKVLFPDGG
jgi:hypothetical protein